MKDFRRRSGGIAGTVCAFNAGKAVVHITTVQIPVNDVLQIGPPEAVLPEEMVVIDMKKNFFINHSV